MGSYAPRNNIIKKYYTEVTLTWEKETEAELKEP
jgi:hypothetical protein